MGCLTRRIMCGRTIARLSGIALSSLRQLSAALQRGGISPLGVCLYRAICQRAWLLLPRLLSKTWIRYGRNPGGTQRLQCQYCKKVWTPKQHALNAAETPEQICSIPLLVPFQGANAFQQLYFLFSFDAVRGNVLHLSSNFTLLSAGKSLHYHWKGIAPPEGEDGDIIHRIAIKERQFYSAVSSMRFSMARRRLNVTRKEQYFARSLRRMVIFEC
ncbi:hypothetical protein IVZ55_14780 [Salmonella enterica subsp. enterica serovar Worthington]|nr:hypothetical protein [Salmonella enterica subsp. enterica serovar Worthington]